MKLSEIYRQPSGKMGFFIVSYSTGLGTREFINKTLPTEKRALECLTTCGCINPLIHFVEVKDGKFNLLEYT